jgi:hypothetical protein
MRGGVSLFCVRKKKANGHDEGMLTQKTVVGLVRPLTNERKEKNGDELGTFYFERHRGI